MTSQEAFDTVLAGLRKQRRKSELTPGGPCRYRSPDGCRCSIGFLIPDELYSPKIEGQPI